jgi:type I restriction enzyme S subunit
MSSEWAKLPLSDIAEVFTGFPFKGDKYLPPAHGVRVVRGDNVTEGFVRWGDKEKCWNEITEDLNSYLLRVGDVVVGMDGSKVGKNFAAISRDDDGVLLAQRVARIRAKEGVCQDFVRYLICNQKFTEYVQSVHTGTSIPHISKGQIERFEVNVPPLKSQIAIASILIAIDNRISLLRETNQTLEAIAQALFKSWFVDFDPVRAKSEGRVAEGIDEATIALFPDTFEDAELGQIPTGWKTKKLGETCAYLSRGISPKYVEAGGVLVLNQKCIRDFSIDYSKARRHNSDLKKVDGRLLELGDVLVNSTGVGTLGRVAQILSLPEQVVVDSHVTVLRAKPAFSWQYLGQWLSRKQPEIQAMGEGSTGQTELSKSKLSELFILVPDQKVLDKFDHIVTVLKNSMAENNSKILVLQDAKNLLVPRLISGQLRIADAEAELEKVTA